MLRLMTLEMVHHCDIIINIMATVKVKLRPSSIEGKAGVIYYKQTGETKVVNERMTLVFYRK